MNKASLNPIKAFDSTVQHEFGFIFNGNQVMKNRLIIRDNSTNTVIYNQIQETMQLKHILPINILTNGKLYNAAIQVYDINNNESPESDKVLFYCYSSPTFNFNNFIEHQVVNNSFYDFNLSYSQSEGEILNSYQIILYSSTKVEIYNSGIKYDDKLSCNINGLLDGNTYFIRAIGETLNGMSLDTGFIEFSVKYIKPSSFSIVDLENKYDQGMTRISSKIILITGKTGKTPIYIDNSKLDLRNDYIVFDKGFEINNDSYLDLQGSHIPYYSTILYSLDTTNSNLLDLKLMYGDFTENNIGKKIYLLLTVKSGNLTYTLTSNYIDEPLETDILVIELSRKNNIYLLKLSKKGV